jgi:hypothetical protein
MTAICAIRPFCRYPVATIARCRLSCVPIEQGVPPKQTNEFGLSPPVFHHPLDPFFDPEIGKMERGVPVYQITEVRDLGLREVGVAREEGGEFSRGGFGFSSKWLSRVRVGSANVICRQAIRHISPLALWARCLGLSGRSSFDCRRFCRRSDRGLLGGGEGEVETARGLKRCFGSAADVQLIDRHRLHGPPPSGFDLQSACANALSFGGPLEPAPANERRILLYMPAM